MNLAAAFAQSAENNLEKTAVFWGDAEYSYRHFRDQAAWVGGTLQRDFGVRPGDRVGLWVKNCPEFISALFGALQAGAVVVPINSFFRPDEVNYILADAGINARLIQDAPAPTRARWQSVSAVSGRALEGELPPVESG